MKISNMREFILLAKNKNYSKTAEDLYIAQSALSRHISSMEEEIGIQLINRTRNTFELTQDGEIALEGFQTILNQYQDTLNRIGHLSESASGELKLGVLYYDMDGYISVIRRTFKKHFPKVKLHLLSYQPSQLEQALFNGDIDAGICYCTEFYRGNDIHTYPFIKMPLSIVYSREHRFAHMENVTFRDLENESLIWPEDMKLTRSAQQLSMILMENGVKIKAQEHLYNFDEIPILIRESQAVYIGALTKPSMYSGELENKLIEPERYNTNISAVWKSDNQNPLISVLLNAIKIAYA